MEIDRTNMDYGPECVIGTDAGVEIRCPPGDEPCSYVRVTEADNGQEIAYWTYDEWKDEPQLVMGAILGAAKGGQV